MMNRICFCNLMRLGWKREKGERKEGGVKPTGSSDPVSSFPKGLQIRFLASLVFFFPFFSSTIMTTSSASSTPSTDTSDSTSAGSSSSNNSSSTAPKSKTGRVCELCSQPGVKVCSGCSKVGYCTKEHQIADWVTQNIRQTHWIHTSQTHRHHQHRHHHFTALEPKRLRGDS